MFERSVWVNYPARRALSLFFRTHLATVTTMVTVEDHIGCNQCIPLYLSTFMHKYTLMYINKDVNLHLLQLTGINARQYV